jgi:hypothetical protein
VDEAICPLRFQHAGRIYKERLWKAKRKRIRCRLLCDGKHAKRSAGRWLKPSPERPPIDLLRPFDEDKMTAWKVDKAVGNVKNDRPELIEPASAVPEEVEEGVEDSPGSLFS